MFLMTVRIEYCFVLVSGVERVAVRQPCALQSVPPAVSSTTRHRAGYTVLGCKVQHRECSGFHVWTWMRPVRVSSPLTSYGQNRICFLSHLF